MLGFLSGDDAVGYFTAGTKISHIGLTIIGSLGTVLLPRCSHLIKIGDNKGFESVIKKSLNLTLALSLPMTAGLMMLAVPITMVFCGSEYIESIPVLYLNAPVVVLISLTNLMGIQVLYPLDKIKIVIESVGGGAFVNLILNFIFIPRYGAIGAAISTLCAETAVLIIQVIKGKRIFPFKISDILSIKYITATLIMSMAVYSVTKLDLSYIMMLCTAIFTSVVVYGASLILMKDDIVAEFCTVLVKTLKR